MPFIDSAVLCPNGMCNIDETCLNCPADCLACPTGTITAKAVKVSDTSCASVEANPLNGTTFSLFTVISPASQTLAGGTPVSWTAPVVSEGTTYTLSVSPVSPKTV